MHKWIRSQASVAFEVHGRVARVTLNNPGRRNALSWDLLNELRQALLEADDLTSVSVIVIDGAGPDFCAGYDMKSAYARYATEDLEVARYRSGNGSFDDDAGSWSDFRSFSVRHSHSTNPSSQRFKAIAWPAARTWPCTAT